MSPRTTFLLTLAGVLLVGLPLPLLTQDAPAAPAPPAEPTQADPTSPCYATLRISGTPRWVKLRCGTREWMAEAPASPAEWELELPAGNRIEIELAAEWEQERAEAASLTLEPEGRESRSDTHWKEEGSRTLHSMYTFVW